MRIGTVLAVATHNVALLAAACVPFQDISHTFVARYFIGKHFPTVLPYVKKSATSAVLGTAVDHGDKGETLSCCETNSSLATRHASKHF